MLAVHFPITEMFYPLYAVSFIAVGFSLGLFDEE